ncbi:DUF5358 family protein [Glaesserella sp.]|uniref:DUF5358 family protein n=1 Tax=Glaesserella sp. TaxID=2094731 RepID=UPI0035A02848
MKKQFFKLITFTLTTFLTACSSFSGLGFHTHTDGPRYKIADEDVKKWIVERNKTEQCLYPKDIRSNRGTLSDGQLFLYQMAVYQHTLNNVIGTRDYDIIMLDPASQQYLAKKLQQFNHTKSVQFEKAWCDNLKAEYKQAIQQTKATIKKQQSEQEAKELEVKKQQTKKEQKIREEAYKQGAELARQEAAQQQEQSQEPEIKWDRTKISWDPASHDEYSF